MSQVSQTILEQYQVRKTKRQKDAFIQWLTSHLQEQGYALYIDQYSNSGRNLVVGDIATAKVAYTAHYDTQPSFIFPVLMGFSNWVSFAISQLLTLVPFVVLCVVYLVVGAWLSPDGAVSLFPLWILLMLYCVQMMFGFANRHTANDNTSGVVTLLAILEKLPMEKRQDVCVVFFDQEELGLVGSSSFKKRYGGHLANTPLINFDCVSDGKHLTFVSKKEFRKSPLYPLLVQAAERTIQGSSKQLRFAPALTNIYMSDQLHFAQGVGVVAAKKAPLFGYYIDRIHSGWDTKFDEENIELLSRTAIEFAAKL